MDKPLVSIITPCYNGEKCVKRYFESILAQTYGNLELIFINDGSEDKTEEIVFLYQQKFKEKGVSFIYLKQKNAGQAAALNRGLKLFNGEYLIWPDSDDVLAPNSIEKKVLFLEKYQEYGMVRSNGLYYNEVTKEKKRISEKGSNSKENIFEDLILLKTYGCCGCYMIRASLLKSIYPKLDIYESRYGQNWQILLPAASKTKCGYIDEDLYTVYEHSDSHSRRKNSSQDEIDKWNGFTDILLEAIQHSDCDQESIKKVIHKNCAENQFYYALGIKDKKKLKEIFRKLRYYGKPTLKEYLLYLKYMYVR